VIPEDEGVAPEVSVVISTRNRAAWLADCLRSLADQDGDTSYEVVVVDNASTDHTSKVIAEWASRDRRFRGAYEPRIGLSVGKNRGIREARAPVLLFTDDDVIVDPGWISAYVGSFAREGTECAGGRVIPVPDDLGPWPTWLPAEAIADLGLLDHGGPDRILPADDYVWGANLAARRTVFERSGMWDESVGRRGDARGTFEDVEFQDRLRDRGVAIWFCERAVVRHRVRRGTITPPRVLDLAFVSGRNRAAARRAARWGTDPAAWPRPRHIAGLSAVAGRSIGWTARVPVFRMSPSKSTFSRARRSAIELGSAVEELRGAGRSFTALESAIARLRRAVAAGHSREDPVEPRSDQVERS
jgi:GT2 family glycosyltransferase